MCVEKLAQVVEVAQDGLSAEVMLDGRIQQALLVVLDPEHVRVRPGDWLTVHSGIALERLADEDAKSRLEFVARVQAAGESDG